MNYSSHEKQNHVPVITLEWQGELPIFFCHVCGSALWRENEESMTCEHLLFSMISESPGIVFYQKDLERQFYELLSRKVKERGGALDDFTDDPHRLLGEELDLNFSEQVHCVASQIDSTSAVCFQLTSSSFVCGLQSITVAVVVDFAR